MANHIVDAAAAAIRVYGSGESNTAKRHEQLRFEGCADLTLSVIGTEAAFPLFGYDHTTGGTKQFFPNGVSES